MIRKPNWAQGEFTPKNPTKYIGTYPIRYRSSWELVFMNKCDTHPSIQQWASESIVIKYYNPFKRRIANYIPDFLIHYMDKNNKSVVVLLEIKPAKQSVDEKAKSKHSQAALALNKVKWAAAGAWAKKNGMQFRVMKETDMFTQKPPSKKRKKTK